MTYGNGDYEEYEYDVLDRLVKVYYNGDTNPAYSINYDANNNIRRLFDGKTTHVYDYDSLGRLVRTWQYDESGNVLGFSYDGNDYYYPKNVQGDVLGIYDSAGTCLVTYTYDIWGKVLSVTGTYADTLGVYNPFRYRSYYYDEGIGLYYLNSRYYDPSIGRFISPDGLIGANGGITGYNLYAYCNNNPVMYSVLAEVLMRMH